MHASQPASPPRRALVTGGAGFIGSHLTGLLLDAGRRVTVVDNLSTGRRENLADRADDPSLRFVEADLGEVLDEVGESGSLGAFDEIYHLAAAVGVKLVMDHPAEAIETNVSLTARLLQAAVAAGPNAGPAATLIASSSEVYGKGVRESFAEDDDVVYGPTTVTRWSYAASKALDEHLALAFARDRGLPVVIVRFFNTVGPRQVGTYGMVLPRFVEAALANEPLRVFGDGSQSRCFGDVRDVAAALPKLLGEARHHGRVFNIGSDEPVTIRSLAELVIEVTGSASTIEPVPYDTVYPHGFEDLRRRQPDLSRIRSAIGYEPKVPLRQTIADLAQELAGRRRSPSPQRTGANP
ncbi:MAG: NAD-dependent epimerase/dehydratase family protein [Phycisphaerales bacterium]